MSPKANPEAFPVEEMPTTIQEVVEQQSEHTERQPAIETSQIFKIAGGLIVGGLVLKYITQGLGILPKGQTRR